MGEAFHISSQSLTHNYRPKDWVVYKNGPARGKKKGIGVRIWCSFPRWGPSIVGSRHRHTTTRSQVHFQ